MNITQTQTINNNTFMARMPRYESPADAIAAGAVSLTEWCEYLSNQAERQIEEQQNANWLRARLVVARNTRQPCCIRWQLLAQIVNAPHLSARATVEAIVGHRNNLEATRSARCELERLFALGFIGGTDEDCWLTENGTSELVFYAKRVEKMLNEKLANNRTEPQGQPAMPTRPLRNAPTTQRAPRGRRGSQTTPTTILPNYDNAAD